MLPPNHPSSSNLGAPTGTPSSEESPESRPFLAALLDRQAWRAGAIGVVPWTFAQTLAGAAIMLVPWFVFLLSSAAAGGGSVPTHSLPRGTDALGGIVAFLFTAIIEGAFLLVPLYVVLNRRPFGTTVREGFRALGARRVSLRVALVLFVLALLFIILLNVVYSAVLQQFHVPVQVNTDVLVRQARYAPLTTIGELLATVLVAPLCEEVFFRGFLFAGLLRRLSLWPALALSALVFALAHGDVGSFVVLFGIGCALALVRWRAGSLWPSVAIHTANNLLAALSVVLLMTH